MVSSSVEFPGLAAKFHPEIQDHQAGPGLFVISVCLPFVLLLSGHFLSGVWTQWLEFQQL